jgi:hypothetical protein
VTGAANLKKTQHAPALGISATLIASSVPATVDPPWSNATLIVPVAPGLVFTHTAMPSIVIAPGVKVELKT